MSNAQLQFRIKMERAIAERLVTDAVNAGYFVSVDNVDEPDGVFTVEPTQDVQKVLAGIAQTDQDHIFCSKDGQQRENFKVWFFLVYGNDGSDVISDYANNAAANNIIKGASKLADELENGNFSLFNPAEIVELLNRILLNEGQDGCCLPVLKFCSCWRCQAKRAIEKFSQ